MENNFNNTTLDSIVPQEKTRPTFLTVLCILTFVGCGFGLISGIYNYVTADSKVAEMQVSMEKVEKTNSQTAIHLMENAQEIVEKSAANKVPVLLITLFGAVCCLAGALMMFKMKKNGFFIYTAGELLPVLAMFFILGMGNGLMGIMMTVFGVFIPLAMVGMYAVNLKDME